MIVNNVAGLAGGGIALQDVARRPASFTIPLPTTTARRPRQRHSFLPTSPPSRNQPGLSRALTARHWRRSRGRSSRTRSSRTTLSGTTGPSTLCRIKLPWPGLCSLHLTIRFWVYQGVIGTSESWERQILTKLNPTWSILTDTTNYGPFIQNRNKIVNNPNSLFVSQYFNYGPAGPAFEVPGVLDEGGNFLRVVFGPLTLSGNHHLKCSRPQKPRQRTLSTVGPQKGL